MCDENGTAGTGGIAPPVLAGRVVATNGDPIPNATVTFGPNSPPHQDVGQLTSEEGVFFYPTLEEGDYEVFVHHPNGMRVKLNVAVSEAAPQNLRIVLPDPPSGDG